MRDDVLHAAGGVVERDGLDAGMVTEEIAALVEGYWVGEHFSYCAEFYAGGGDQVVHDPEQEFGLNKDFMGDQEIGVFGDSAGQRVLDGDDSGGDRSTLNAVEYFGGSCAGDNCAAWEHALGGFVAEGTEVALDGNFHGGFRRKARELGEGGKCKI